MVPPRYVQNPLLLDGKKFDVRSYMLIACAMPYMVFFGHGYARLTLSLYNPHSSDLSGHLTNQFMQKKSPLYMLLKDSTVWSMEHLNRYINDKFRKSKGLPRDWVFTTFTVTAGNLPTSPTEADAADHVPLLPGCQVQAGVQAGLL